MKYLLTSILLLLSILVFSQNKKWNFIHESDRLEMIKENLCVTGFVVNCYKYLDGDFVVKLKLDSNDYLLNKFNYQKLEGLLEVEIICEHRGMFIECLNYINDIKVPKIGDHIRVCGSYVRDKRHKWCEIHPVNLLEFL